MPSCLDIGLLSRSIETTIQNAIGSRLSALLGTARLRFTVNGFGLRTCKDYRRNWTSLVCRFAMEAEEVPLAVSRGAGTLPNRFRDSRQESAPSHPTLGAEPSTDCKTIHSLPSSGLRVKFQDKTHGLVVCAVAPKYSPLFPNVRERLMGL